MNNPNIYPQHNASNEDSRKRRYLELTRRLGVLKYRRDRLTIELKAINVAMSSLDQQMRQDKIYQQLSIGT